jgi:hypothetical protein
VLAAQVGSKEGKAMNIIRAVAVGEKYDQDITSLLDDLSNVRPYVMGLRDELKDRGYGIGADYMIQYRQREATDLPSAFTGEKDLILCMSTTVVHAAQLSQDTAISKKPIVGIVSDPHEEKIDKLEYICGVSAGRFQTAGACFRQFYDKTNRSLETIYVLHKVQSNPSKHAHDNAYAVAKSLIKNWIAIAVTNSDEIGGQLDAVLPARNPDDPITIGVFVLPVDVNFGAASDIISVANGKYQPVWFPTPAPDWWAVEGYGGYGVAQSTCGGYMAERVDFVWQNWNNGISGPPAKRWTEIPAANFQWSVSRKTAAHLHIPLDGIAERHIR